MKKKSDENLPESHRYEYDKKSKSFLPVGKISLDNLGIYGERLKLDLIRFNPDKFDLLVEKDELDDYLMKMNQECFQIMEDAIETAKSRVEYKKMSYLAKLKEINRIRQRVEELIEEKLEFEAAKPYGE